MSCLWFYSCNLYLLTSKSKQTAYFTLSVTALFNQKFNLIVICVFYLNCITCVPTTPPRELKLLTWGALGPGVVNILHPENMWVIRLISKTYLHNCTYRADVYILGHYRLIPISLHPYLLNIMHCCIFRKYKALETQQATNFRCNKESSNIIMHSNFGYNYL